MEINYIAADGEIIAKGELQDGPLKTEYTTPAGIIEGVTEFAQSAKPMPIDADYERELQDHIKRMEDAEDLDIATMQAEILAEICVLREDMAKFQARIEQLLTDANLIVKRHNLPSTPSAGPAYYYPLGKSSVQAVPVDKFHDKATLQVKNDGYGITIGP